LTDKKEIRDWVKNNLKTTTLKVGDEFIKIKPNGIVDISSSLIVLKDDVEYIKVQFGKGVTFCIERKSKLQSFKGIPNDITTLSINLDHQIPFDGIEKAEMMSFQFAKFESLKNIHKHVQYCRQFTLPQEPTKNILDVLKIKGLEEAWITCYTGTIKIPPGPKRDYKLACDIINRAAGGSKADILKAQDELLDNDLEDYI